MVAGFLVSLSHKPPEYTTNVVLIIETFTSWPPPCLTLPLHLATYKQHGTKIATYKQHGMKLANPTSSVGMKLAVSIIW